MTTSGLPNDSLEKMFLNWINIINRQESASIIGISKRSQIYRIDQFLSDDKFLSKKLKDYKEVQFIKIDPSLHSTDNYSDFEKNLKKSFSEEAKRFVFLVTSADKFIYESPEVLSFINSYVLNNVDSSVLFFFEKNINIPSILRKIDSYPVVFQNIFYVGPFSKKDVNHFIKYQAKKFKVTLSKEIKNKLIKLCGSRLGLITSAIRYYARTKDEKEMFSHEEITLQLRLIYHDLENEEKTVLEKIIEKNYQFDEEDKPALDYFLKTGIIEKGSLNSFKIAIPLFESYLEKQIVKKVVIQVNNNHQITINGLVVDEFFSKREKRLLRYFIDHKNTVIDRETVASFFWGREYAEKYTDWALDQALRRLRNKFIKLGLHKDIIKTKKNLGLIFVN